MTIEGERNIIIKIGAIRGEKAMQKIIVDKNSAGQRVDRFLMKTFPELPAGLMYKAFRKKDIKIDGKWVRESGILKEGCELTIFLPDDALITKKEKFVPAEGTIEVIYEDENICVIDKPAGVECQSGEAGKVPLCEMFKTYLYNKKEYDPEREQSFAPALCNRLDTNTMGLVIGAKNAAALRAMNEAIRKREVKKFYLCKTEGVPPKMQGEIELYLKKDERQNKVFPSRGGVRTLTGYKVLQKTEGGALCEVELLTGKTHQIRAVMSYLGCPIEGDKKYGASASGGQKLVAYRLEFEIKNPMLDYLNGKKIYSKYTL